MAFSGRSPRKLVLEGLAVVAVVAIAATAIWWFTRPAPIHNARPVGGPNVDVSQNQRAQWSPSAAADPANPRVLLAGSIDQLEDTRVYSSRDGGSSWTSVAAPPGLRANCGRSDPAVAIGRGGRQVYAFLATFDCRPLDPHLHVAWRESASARWHVRRVAPGPRGRFVFDQRPALATGRNGFVLTWLRFIGIEHGDDPRVYVSRSVDGKEWAAPLRLPFEAPYMASVTTAADGDVYVAVADAVAGLVVLRSRNGGRTFGRPARIVELPGAFAPACGHGNVLIPAQPQRCVGPSPTVSVGRSRVYVTFGRVDPNRTQGVGVATLDRSLRLLRIGRVGPPDEDVADQFTPVSAVDRSSEDLWACFYDTTGDPTRKHAWFTCTVSDDEGRRWAPPVRAASVRSDETRFSADNDGYGDVQALVADDGVAHPFWTDSRRLSDSEEIYTTRLQARRLLGR